MQHYRCPKCGASAYSSASARMVKCPRCSEPLTGASPDAPLSATERAVASEAAERD
jgi:ribosomal protein L37AE/L43A